MIKYYLDTDSEFLINYILKYDFGYIERKVYKISNRTI